MSDIRAERVSKQQYIVHVKSAEMAQGLTRDAGGITQSNLEKNLSSDERQVLTLTADQVERLRAQGIKVTPNRIMSIPKPEVLDQQKLTPAELSRMAGTGDRIVPIGIRTHGAEKLHAVGITGKDVYNVVIDTGIKPHPDLPAARIEHFYDVFAATEVAPVDPHGHGTHVAGTMGANGKLLGMAPDSKFIGIKVLDDNGSGTMASVMAGVEQAMKYYQQGLRPMVVNMSLGGWAGPVAEDELVAMVKKAADMGISFSIAAGNEGPQEDTIGSPGTTHHAHVLTVAAADTKGTVGLSDDKVTYFSSRGGSDTERGQNDKPNILADGYRVMSLGTDDDYKAMSGTSMASPGDAGAQALLKDLAQKMAARGDLKVTLAEVDIEKALLDSALDHPKIPAIEEGRGEMRVDVAAKLIADRYGKTGRPGDAEFVPARDLAGRSIGTDYEKSIEANRAAAREHWKKARTFDQNPVKDLFELIKDSVWGAFDWSQAESYKVEKREATRNAKS